MNHRNIIQRIIRKVRKTLGIHHAVHEKAETREERAIAIGKTLELERRGFIFHCDKLKPDFYLPLYKKDYIQQRIITEEKYYEQDVLNHICFEWHDGVIHEKIQQGCLLDIGANIGNHTLYFFYECGIKKAFCFEPILSTYLILQKNIALNHLNKKTTLINAAVGAQTGLASVSHYDETNIGSTQITKDSSGAIKIISIDSLNIKEHIDFIKIDVEGFEKSVIDGCISTIERDKPYIMIEIQKENFSYISEVLLKMGYNHYQLNSVNYLFYV